MVKPGDFVKVNYEGGRGAGPQFDIVERTKERKPEIGKNIVSMGTVIETRTFVKVIMGTTVEWIDGINLEIAK